MAATNLRAILMGVAFTAVAGCSVVDLFKPGARDELALVIFYRDTSSVVAPDTVVRGAPFEVSIATYGGGCTRTVAHTAVTVAGNVAAIRPYNTTTGDAVCTSDLLILQHVAQIRLDAPGTSTIRVIGQQQGASTGDTKSPAELIRIVTVR